jgi:hypothetical protein
VPSKISYEKDFVAIKQSQEPHVINT